MMAMVRTVRAPRALEAKRWLRGILQLGAATWLLAAVGTLAGCATRPGVATNPVSPTDAAGRPGAAAPFPAAAPPGATSASAADAELGRLWAEHRELEQRLAAVEGELLTATARSSASMTEAAAARASVELVALLERRIGLTLALRRLEQTVERRTLELRLGLGALPAAAAPRAGSVDLVAEATRQLGELRARGDLADQQDMGPPQAKDRLKIALAQPTPTTLLPAQGSGEDEGSVGGVLGLLGGRRGSLDDDLGGAHAVLTSPDDPFDGWGLRGTGKGGGGIGAATGTGAPLTGHRRGPAKAERARPSGGEARDLPKEGGKSVAAAVVQDSATAVDLSAVPRHHLDRMLQCLPESLRSGGLRIEVKARLGADGGLYQPRVSSSVELPATVESCLVDALTRIRFPAPADGASRVVSFPVWLGPEG